MKPMQIEKQHLLDFLDIHETRYAECGTKKLSFNHKGIFSIYERVKGEWDLVWKTVDIEDAINKFNNLD